jgi:hypothetical protein
MGYFKGMSITTEYALTGFKERHVQQIREETVVALVGRRLSGAML